MVIRHIKILLVEDEQQVREILEEYLTLWGYENVVVVTDGREALTFLQNEALLVDLLITDETMPGGVKGSDLIAYAREHRQATRIIHMSGDPFSRGDPPENMKRISKPISFPELKGLIEGFFPSGGEAVPPST